MAKIVRKSKGSISINVWSLLPTQGKFSSFFLTYAPVCIRNEDSTNFFSDDMRRYIAYLFDQDFLSTLIFAVLIYKVFNSSGAQW